MMRRRLSLAFVRSLRALAHILWGVGTFVGNAGFWRDALEPGPHGEREYRNCERRHPEELPLHG